MKDYLRIRNWLLDLGYVLDADCDCLYHPDYPEVEIPYDLVKKYSYDLILKTDSEERMLFLEQILIANV